MLADRIVIRTSAQYPGPGATRPELFSTMRAAMTECSLPDTQIEAHSATLHWRDPKRLPGLHLMIHDSGDDLRVTLAQDLYGPVGPTDAYQCVQKALRRQLLERFGKDRVHLES